LANRLNAGPEATKWTVQVGAVTNTSAFSIAVNGNDLSVNVGSAQTAAQLAARFASVANADSGISADILARASGAYLVLSARTAAFDIISAVTSVGTVGGAAVAGVAAARVADGQAALANVSVATAASGGVTMVRLVGTTAGYDFSVANISYSGVTTSIAAHTQGPGFSATVSNYAANLIAQTAVSATTSGAVVILTATDAGTAFSAGSFTLNTTAFATTTTVANDAGGNTAAEVATNLAALAAASLSDLSVGASGAAITVAGTVNGTAVTAGDLSDGTSTISYTQTQASRVDVSGNTAASVATLLVSAVNAGESTVGAVVSGAAMVLTATTAGVGFTASTLNDGTDTASYTAVTANAALQAISSEAGAQSAISLIDNVLDTVNLERANLGAVMNRLEYAMDNLANVSMNISDSRSRIEDADYAKATTELARTQIIQQAATSILAQANQQPQMVLSLLQ